MRGMRERISFEVRKRAWIWEEGLGSVEECNPLLYCGLGDADAVAAHNSDIGFLVNRMIIATTCTRSNSRATPPMLAAQA